MTVAELIELLKTAPQDLEVMSESGDDGPYIHINFLSIEQHYNSNEQYVFLYDNWSNAV